MASTIRRNPLTDQVVAALLTRLAAGEWPVGHKLPGETTLAATLGVGRSTVREAIRELAGRGMLEPRQGAGVFVLSVEPREDWDIVLRRAGILEVIEARMGIECEAARLAAARRTPADLRALRVALEQREAAAREGDDAAYVDADTAFHRAMVAAAHNEVLLGIFDAFIPRGRAAMIDMLHLTRQTPRRRHDHDAHGEILSAVRDRRAEEAGALARAHLGELHHEFSR